MSFRKTKSQYLDAYFDEAEQAHTLLHLKEERNRQALHLRCEQGLVVAPYKGLYARSDYWNVLGLRERMKHLIRALSQQHSSWVFSHSSAAVIHNLEVSYQILRPLHYQTDSSLSSRYSEFLKQHKVKNSIGLTRDGARVTSLEQTVVDCACQYDFKLALPIADSALHQGLTTKERLTNCLENRTNRRGVRKARRIIEYADHRADNGGESIVRAIMIENNLPKPELQAPIENPDRPGHFYYADFLFTRKDGVKVAFELDGKEKYTSKEMLGSKSSIDAMMAERQREAAITSQGIRVARLGFKDASNPSILLHKLAQYGVVPEP